jgi:heme/copper-type cytochrome/quinol oxidase subunit 2
MEEDNRYSDNSILEIVATVFVAVIILSLAIKIVFF